MAAVEPSRHSGTGRDVGASAASQGGFVGKVFSSRSPPDVQPTTRIIALCGITDSSKTDPNELSDDDDDGNNDKISSKSKTGPSQRLVAKGKKTSRPRSFEGKEPGHASPKNDGWFFSDFFLFYQLFRGMGANQLWLTSEEPRDLIERYGRYGHGDPQSDHRVVLDQSLLADLEAAQNVRVFERKELKEDFLRTFRGECELASELNQSILLLIFGHGDDESYGIRVGGNGIAATDPRVNKEDIITIVRKLNLSLTMMLTSCYSGGWLVQPDLNVTALTAADKSSTSRSWIGSIGRSFHGSMYATAVSRAFIKTEDALATQYNPSTPSQPIRGRYESSSSYAELTKVINDIFTYETDTAGKEPATPTRNTISFSAQDDRWDQEWRRRSGVPLSDFQAQWDRLPRLAPQPKTIATIDWSVGNRTGGSGPPPAAAPTVAKGFYGLHWTFRKSQAHNIVRDACHGYLANNPPADNISGNQIFHGHVRRCLEDPNFEPPAYLLDVLRYRLGSDKVATEYKKILGLKGPDCHGFSFQAWNCDEAKVRKWHEYRILIAQSRVVEPPTIWQGDGYTKPVSYLAVACVENGLTTLEVEEAIQKMLEVKEERVKSMTETIRKNRLVRRIGSQLFNTLGKRMRELSPPRRRSLIPSFEDVSSES